MTRRENFFSLVKREGFQQMPIDFDLCPYLEELYYKKTGANIDYKEYFGMTMRRLPELVLQNDNVERFHKYHKSIDENTVIDKWGVGHRSTPTSMHMTQMLYPLEKATSVDHVLNYPFPVSNIEKSKDLITRQVQDLKKRDLIAVGNMQTSIWETSWYIRGMENLMMDMMTDDEVATALLDKVTQLNCDNNRIYIESGADVLYLGDDIGMQSSPMMSLELYRKWLKPRLDYMVKQAKSINPDIIVFYHSCGYIEPFIPDLIEIGIDVLNPIQPESMDFKSIYNNFGNEISFHGTIGTQTTMPHGSPENVKEEVEKNLRIAGEKGGLLVAPTHLLEPEVPWENIIAYVEACKNFKL